MAFLYFAPLILGFIMSGFVCLLSYVVIKYRNVAPQKKLPGPKPSYLFGNTLQFEREPFKLVEQILNWFQEHRSDGYICLWLGPVDTLILTFKPELAEVILSSSKHTRKSKFYDFLHPWLGTGLLTRILNGYIQVFEEQAEILLKSLEAQVDKGEFDIMPYIALCALDIICITSMDSSPNAQQKADSPYVKAVVRMSELVQLRQRSPWVWLDFMYSLTPSGREHDRCIKILHDFTNKVIDEQIATRAARKSLEKERDEEREEERDGTCRTTKRLAFLDLLLDCYDRGEISREGVREEVDTFMFEGHDTTAAGITWALYLIGCHSSVQMQVCEEVDKFFEQRPDKRSVEDLKELRYLECVIKEAQRMFPSVPFFARTMSEDCYLNDSLILKGTEVGVAPIGLHRNPEVWPQPYKFNPDRFLPENCQGRHPYAFVPFSAGPRNCIGQKFALLEEKIVLAYIFRHFMVESTQSFGDLKTCAELITRPKDGIFVSLSRRK